MRAALSRTIRWNGHSGAAYFDGVHVPLKDEPSLPGLMNIAELDYAPLVEQCRVRQHSAQWRALTKAEARALDAALERMVRDARASFKVPCT